ncbi:hypothetical protein [Nostoc sp.]|uniref:hypothetical protein n=1 Tax=Nostoc sp. TaxID=1180 RepID=UPI002FF50193
MLFADGDRNSTPTNFRRVPQTVRNRQRVELYEGADKLPILEGIELELTVEQIFGWLSLT